jgi:hypothetical protein
MVGNTNMNHFVHKIGLSLFLYAASVFQFSDNQLMLALAVPTYKSSWHWQYQLTSTRKTG